MSGLEIAGAVLGVVGVLMQTLNEKSTLSSLIKSPAHSECKRRQYMACLAAQRLRLRASLEKALRAFANHEELGLIFDKSWSNDTCWKRLESKVEVAAPRQAAVVRNFLNLMNVAVFDLAEELDIDLPPSLESSLFHESMMSNESC